MGAGYGTLIHSRSTVAAVQTPYACPGGLREPKGGVPLSDQDMNREPGSRARGPLGPLLHAVSAPFRLVGRIAQRTGRALTGRP
jgi:hypothetical protein